MAVAQRIYANALFDAAKEQDSLEQVRSELREFTDAVDSVPELHGLLTNPELDSRIKVDALRAVLGDAHELVRNFLLLVAEKGRTDDLEGIVEEFEALVAAEEGILDVELTTAVELSDDAAQSILEQIERVSGRKLRATRSVDAMLIGGFVLQAGSHRADASVRSRLEGLRRQMTGTGRS